MSVLGVILEAGIWVLGGRAGRGGERTNFSKGDGIEMNVAGNVEQLGGGFDWSRFVDISKKFA